MIKSFAYDIEIFPNLFSISIVNVNSYLEIFKDCVNAKNKPIPLIQKLTVKEIKERLDKVEKWQFHITDKDDSQLLSMLGFLNNMQPHYDENGKPIRCDMFGYNSNKYDKLMIAAFLMYANQTNTTKELIKKLYELSQHIINSQNDKDAFRKDFLINSLNNYNLPYVNIDVMTIFALNKCGKGVDKDGNTIYFPKSLKQTSINLQWYELLEYELPPIKTEEEANLYRTNYEYKNWTIEQLNRYIKKWDRIILDEYISELLRYNTNDVYIVCEMIRMYIDEIKLRYNITKSYEVNVLSSSRSNIADALFVKFYSEFSGLHESQWRGRKTERTAMAFNKIIFPFIHFKTKECQELLNEMKQIVIYSLGKKGIKDIANKYPNFKHLKTNTKSGWFEVTINKLVYSIATGGLHSQDVPRELKSKLIYDGNTPTGDKNESIWNSITDDSYIFIHFDISSFYPSIIVAYNIAPKHLDTNVFVRLVKWLRDTRIEAKHSKEEYIDGIQKDLLALVLKIVINSIYGKFSFEYGDLYDRLQTLKVTINGQLMIMMLCEELELNGIEVMSANTDGIIVKVYKKDKELFDKITTEWMNNTKLSADSEDFKLYINRDINNYLAQELNGKIDSKGALCDTMYLKDLQKGYDMPIVAKAVVEYFLNDTPILETLYNATNILDFCKSQNVGRQFHVEYTTGLDNTKVLQQNVRFYVANKGGTIEKVHNEVGSRNNLCAGYKTIVLNSLDDERIEYRDINYKYYYNEAMKIIDPIKLGISPNQKGSRDNRSKSGKSLIKANSHQYLTLFDNES